MTNPYVEADALGKGDRDPDQNWPPCDGHDWMEFGGPGDEWRECFLCGLQEDR